MDEKTTTHIDSLEAVTGSVSVKTIPIQGEVLTISPVKFKNIPSLIRVASPIMEEVKTLKLNNLTASNAGSDTAMKVGVFLENYQQELTSALALMSGKSEDWVGECDANEITDLFLKCISVNIDFFTRRWLPTMSEHLNTVKQLTALVGSSKFTN